MTKKTQEVRITHKILFTLSLKDKTRKKGNKGPNTLYDVTIESFWYKYTKFSGQYKVHIFEMRGITEWF